MLFSMKITSHSMMGFSIQEVLSKQLTIHHSLFPYDNNAIEVDNNIIEQSEDTVLDDATHPEIQPDITQQSTGETSNAGIIQTRSKSGIHKPNLPYNGLAETYKDTMEPTNAKDALTRSLWKEAMEKEF
ncbi:hypothetical protein KIW84_020549 [Lathyrus oleraceus]|uniref:Uncharacterized protein n=1 Tax=Pisum sativum TaxID=3888 RepID=A0A9D4Y7N6_PEA|nr:hypothetical protein KIW84_020549 [Pisum sativum]